MNFSASDHAPVYCACEYECIYAGQMAEFMFYNMQSRLYLGLARDGLLPSIFSKVHLTRHTPIHSQIWVGCVAAVLGGLFNVHMLSHILSVGTLVQCHSLVLNKTRSIYNFILAFSDNHVIAAL